MKLIQRLGRRRLKEEKKPVFYLDPEREKLKRRLNQEKASPEEFEKV
jgi:hypothetical protein